MYNYGYRDYVPQTARFSTIDPIRDGSNWFAYCNNEPVNFRDAWGLAINGVVATNRMNEGEWAENPINNIEGNQNRIKEQGCAIALVAMFASSASGKNITPKDINDNPSSFVNKNSIDLDWKAAGENVGLTIERSGKDTASVPAMIKKAANSNESLYLGVQVPVTTNNGIVDHWVAVDGQPVIINGEEYLKVAGTSINDNSNRTRNENWISDYETGALYVKSSAVTGVVVAKSNKNK